MVFVGLAEAIPQALVVHLLPVLVLFGAGLLVAFVIRPILAGTVHAARGKKERRENGKEGDGFHGDGMGRGGRGVYSIWRSDGADDAVAHISLWCAGDGMRIPIR